jgi:hypothetical protein
MRERGSVWGSVPRGPMIKVVALSKAATSRPCGPLAGKSRALALRLATLLDRWRKIAISLTSRISKAILRASQKCVRDSSR